MMRLISLMLSLSVSVCISDGLANSLAGEETVNTGQRSAHHDALPPTEVAAAAYQSVDMPQRIARGRLPFKVTAAAQIQDRLSNERDTVAATLKPLSEFQFQTDTAADEVQPKDYFANLKVQTESPAVSPHAVGWAAAGMVHRPFYFEEHCLEQCGVTAAGIRQPFVSGTKFFVRGIFFPLQALRNRPHTLEASNSNECNFFDE